MEGSIGKTHGAHSSNFPTLWCSITARINCSFSSRHCNKNKTHLLRIQDSEKRRNSTNVFKTSLFLWSFMGNLYDHDSWHFIMPIHSWILIQETPWLVHYTILICKESKGIPMWIHKQFSWEIHSACIMYITNVKKFEPFESLRLWCWQQEPKVGPHWTFVNVMTAAFDFPLSEEKPTKKMYFIN